ncbi:oligosaccharide flippase family protein [Streptococcus uberis]|uniref:oligosaccharide flippase family protein n=1 Tax=Streptococcus uberis TaxID=1349 RepID=UPI0021F1EEBA|nr:oligosaccharide flippase family protein [Streptococcus uberis]MCV6815197.1 polysaccharide biosynthesis C-terminal domain-containing protein [Streptococcus uberis]MCZ8476194.1 polysaccharide biosynthesis C-terminal domain-containing protein [Streptococcus uberis]
MEKDNLGKNLIYQIVYQLLLVALPLITSPYLARVLGAKQLGLFSYSQSLANYFVFLAALGVNTYGTRSIAGVSKNILIRSKTFLEIFILQFFSSLTAIVSYILFILAFNRNNLILGLIQGLLILATLLDINWFYFGLEKFRITVTRNLIVKLASVFSIILFVKKPEDLWIYALIMSLSILLSNGILWYFIPNLIDIRLIKTIKVHDVLKHLKPNLILFFPLLAIAIYRIMDKTMLGLMSTFHETGFYYNSDKVINIPIGILLGISTVMLPRTSNLLGNGKEDESNNLFLVTVDMIIALSIGMAFGISSISFEFTPIFFGDGFSKCIFLIIYMSPLLLIKGLSETFRMQYLIPKRMEKIFTRAVVYGAVVNFAVNMYTIPRFGSIGAVIGTTIAEIISCIIQFLGINNSSDLTFKRNLKSKIETILIYSLFGIIMFIVVRFLILNITKLLHSTIAALLISVIIGALTYLIQCLIYWKLTKNPILINIKFLKFFKKFTS